MAMDIDAPYFSFAPRYYFNGFEHGEVLVMGASKCIPFDYSCSLIPGVADLGYNSTTLSWIFKFIRCELIQDIETLPFNELRCIACAASDWNLYCLQNLCRLALRRFRNQSPKEILALTVNCGYLSLLPTLAETKLIDTPLAGLQDILRDPFLYRAWSLFRDHRIACLEQVKERHNEVHPETNCATWATESAATYLKLERPSVMEPTRMSQVFEPRGNLPPCCSSALERWRKQAMDTCSKAEPGDKPSLDMLSKSSTPKTEPGGRSLGYKGEEIDRSYPALKLHTYDFLSATGWDGGGGKKKK
ncbi:hypothetical protein BT96DRAFT_1007790 [Gymnopus androsaceus JB14]|uniref:Uncharacterized protein n=1 Tax=Gymnopus androsaceus JB14 TaxID=1447944 RepID=A0A6A4GH45_9AGAR|nr:hypothetical protein BT96DRAFT_1007790 [Gymnopus androsaceus JB14]